MFALFIQLLLTALWGTVLTIHTRRLFRLAHVAVPSRRAFFRSLQRAWWWLGREEYWRAVQIDGMRGTQMSLIIVVLCWSFGS